MSTLYRFDRFILDPQRRTLYRGDEVVDLPESAFMVLETLVRKAPDTIDKETLIDIAWPDTAVVPDNLVQAVHAIRSTLGGDARNPRFVQTVHRRGYRFLAPVEEVDSEQAALTEQRQPKLTIASGRPRRRILGLFLIAAVIVVAAGVTIARVVRRSSVGSHPQVHTLAVLPLENLSGDPDQEYFADGMTDLLITELARLETIAVISRTSVMKFKATQMAVPDIARELGVDAIVEGSVTRSGGRIRVIAQLVDSRDHHIWGESYEYDDREILQLQRDFATAIAREIGTQVRPRSADLQPLEVDPQAHEAVLRGHHVLRERTEEAILRSQEFFRQAIAIAPGYASAYAGMAETYNLQANYGFAPSSEVRPRARAMAEKALQHDPDLVEAHLALAHIAAEYDWNFAESEREYRAVISLRPSSPVARARYAHLLVAAGELDRAIEETRLARRLDPLSEIVNANVGWLLVLDQQDEAAEDHLLEVLDFTPDFAVAQYYLGALYDRQERFSEALTALHRAADLSGGSSYAVGALVHALARSGDQLQAEEILDTLLEQRSNRYVSPIGLAVAHFGLGRVDEAFALLDEAFAERKGWLLHLRYEPALDGVRDDPRYLELVARIGLPAHHTESSSTRRD